MPKLRKVVDPPKQKIKPLDPAVPQPPALVLMVMPCKCGKTTQLSNYFLSNDFYGQDYFDNVNIISTTINNDTTARFLRQAFDCEDHYEDGMIHKIVSHQKSFGNVEDMPLIALCIDDCLGEKTTALDNLASRRRHVNIGLMCVSTQLFRKVSPTIRANATNVIIGKLTNEQELEKLSEEYSGMFYDGKNADANFRRLYGEATKKKYETLHLNLQENPAEAWISYHTKIWPKGDTSMLEDDA